MALNNVDRERITDCVLKIQSVRNSLEEIENESIPNEQEIETCLETADHNLRVALGYVPLMYQTCHLPGQNNRRATKTRREVIADWLSKPSCEDVWISA